MSTRSWTYDVFLSYRHLEPDQGLALELAERMTAAGLRVALDRRTFEPQEPFLLEMDRCIRESHFTVALLSARYFASGDCTEEALLTRVRDLKDRERRFIPVMLEDIRLPVWIALLTGIRLYDRFATDDPRERLIRILREKCLSEEEQRQHPLPVPNPFYYGGMVLEPTRFIGRTRLLNTLREQLVMGASWLVLGERRMGKSSLLWHLTTVTLSDLPGLEPVYLDLQRIERCDRQTWLIEVLRALRERARARGLEWPWGEPSADSELLRQVCMRWTQTGHRPVLLLDEGEKMGNPTLGFDRGFLDFLRSLNNARQLSLVIACQRSVALHLLESNGTSPWHNLCQTEYLGPWKRVESLELLKKGAPVLRADLQEWLVEQVGDWPGLLQYAARNPVLLTGFRTPSGPSVKMCSHPKKIHNAMQLPSHC